jgi:hypothetical protein
VISTSGATGAVTRSRGSATEAGGAGGTGATARRGGVVRPAGADVEDLLRAVAAGAGGTDVGSTPMSGAVSAEARSNRRTPTPTPSTAIAASARAAVIGARRAGARSEPAGQGSAGLPCPCERVERSADCGVPRAHHGERAGRRHQAEAERHPARTGAGRARRLAAGAGVHTASYGFAPATVARWPTTHPKRCSPSS